MNTLHISFTLTGTASELSEAQAAITDALAKRTILKGTKLGEVQFRGDPPKQTSWWHGNKKNIEGRGSL